MAIPSLSEHVCAHAATAAAKLLEAVRAAGQSERVGQIEARLRLYQQGRAYHEEK